MRAGELSDLHPALVVSRRTSSIQRMAWKIRSPLLSAPRVPAGLVTFNDDGRLIGPRPAFSMLSAAAAAAAVINIVEEVGLLWFDSS